MWQRKFAVSDQKHTDPGTVSILSIARGWRSGQESVGGACWQLRERGPWNSGSISFWLASDQYRSYGMRWLELLVRASLQKSQSFLAIA